MKKSMISLLIKSQGKQHIPMLRLNESLAHLTRLIPSSNAVITMTNTHLAPNKLRLLTLSGLILSSLTLSVFLSPIANAALSATTANTIKGTLPALTFDGGTTIANDLDELVSLTMPDPAGGATPVDITPTLYPTTTTPVNAKVGVKFSDFTTKVTANDTALTLPATYFYDADGDTPDPIAPVGGTLKATWTYQLAGATKTVTAGELGNPLNACNAPYTLTLDANNVSAKSEYGDPNLNNYGSKIHTYTVNISDYKFCYAKPADMRSFNGSGLTTANCLYNDCYNPDVFVPTLGFIPKSNRPTSAKPNFPTSGFDGAKFTLVMSNNQSDYTYVSSNGLAVVNTNGEVTLDNGGNRLVGNQAVTITATPSDASFPSQTYQFTVQASQWARVPTQATPTGTQYNTSNTFTGTYPAVELCSGPVGAMGTGAHANGVNYLFNRSDFSSGPDSFTDHYDFTTANWMPSGSATAPVLTYASYFSRDINGKFNDEWGDLYTGNPYPLSGFGASNNIWTAEAYDSDKQFIVYSNNSYIVGSNPYGTNLAVCR